MPRVKKSLGQNFLMHARTAERIADAANLSLDAIVFEIGPGTGMLTRALLARAKKVVAVEADNVLYPELEKTFAPETADGRLELIHADIRSFDLESLPKGYHAVANIPYYLTGELFRRLLTAHNQPRSMTFLVQKEVAERIARSKKESLLSLSVKAYGTPKYAFTVPRGAFVPAPNVDSAVLVISGISRSNFSSKEHEERFFSILHAGFAHKRKLLSSNLRDAGIDAPFPPSVPLKARAEDVRLTEWLALAR